MPKLVTPKPLPWFNFLTSGKKAQKKGNVIMEDHQQ
jgi:hypothetical protein